MLATAQRTTIKNPFEEVGISGRGSLWYYEANYAADALLIREGDSEKSEQILAIQRGDGSWATPGGFHDPGESAREASLRELGEEAIENIDLVEDHFTHEAVCVYQGYGVDPRNTDDAWIETSLYVLRIPDAEAQPLIVRASDDAQDARWIDVQDINRYQWYGNHYQRIREAVSLTS